jgi:membrane fusion protein, multidrug efflux system
MTLKEIALPLLLVLAMPGTVLAESPVPTPDAITLPSDSVTLSDALDQAADRESVASKEELLRAQIKAQESTQIASEMAGRISQLKIRDGERFHAGQILVAFNCSQENAELEKARATLEKKRKTHEVNQKLEHLKSISTLQLAVSKTEEDEASADVRVGQAIVAKCFIKAPFAGKVVDVTAHAHQSVRPGDPLLEIISEKDLEIEFIAPSKLLPQLKPGSTFKVKLTETDKTYNAAITRLGGRVDPVSQTIKVYARITDHSPEILPGMSGAIELSTAE